VSLGQACEFALTRTGGQPVETRIFLKHDQIFYLDPLAEWGERDLVRLFPEAPGTYRLAAQWRTADGATGWAEARFEVVTGAPPGEAPRVVQIDRQTRLWVPTAWESEFMAHHEQSTLAALRDSVRPGFVVYDVGAHLGLYTVLLARMVGAAGRVYAVEANPVCVSFLDANLRLNAIQNAEILPVAIAEGVRICEFTINYHNFLVGIGQDSPYAGKPGHRIRVGAIGLDELIETYALREPDVVKMDIEGGEIVAVPGMQRTIARRRPTLVIELHGQLAARKTLEGLAWASYRYREPRSGKTFPSAAELAAWFPDECLQVIGSPA
jgi:FkbM family methyltransferase